MKKIYLSLIMFLIGGCTGSNIKIVPAGQTDGNYNMFGKVPSREFYNASHFGDSLIMKWEGEVNGGFTQSSVTYYKNYVFVNDLSGRITCFDINTGERTGQLKHEGAIYTTPVIYKYNLIYIESKIDEDKSLLHIYNIIEGRQIAATEFNGRVQTEIIMLDKRIYFVTEKGLLYKFSHIGDMYWVKDLNSTIHTSPGSDGKDLYLTTDDGDILAITGETGDIIYRKKTEEVITSGLAISGEDIIVGGENGTVYSILKSTGELKWKNRSKYKITAFPVIHNGKVFIVNLGGEILSIDMNTSRSNWITEEKGVYNITPLLTENYLIVPDYAGRLLFIDVNNGKMEKIFELPNRVKLSPVLHGNILFTGYDRGILVAYEVL